MFAAPTTEIEFAQPLTLTPSQETGLRQMWVAVQQAQRVVTLYLQYRALGHEVALLDVARLVVGAGAAALPILPGPTATVSRPVLRVDDLLTEFRAVRDAFRWDTLVPAEAYEVMIRQTCKAFRDLPPSGLTVADLPSPWPTTQPLTLHLNRTVSLLDPVSIEVAPLGQEARVLAEAYLLPRLFWEALVHDQQQNLSRLRADIAALNRAWLDGADEGAAARALRLRARYAAFGMQLESAVPPPECPELPRRRNRVVLRQAFPDGFAPRYEVVWAFDLEGCPLPQPSIDDTVGIDPGERYVFAWANGWRSGAVPRPVRGDWRLPEPELDASVLRWPLDLPTARMYQRWQLFQRFQVAYEDLLALCLSHRVVALEDVDFAGFRAKGKSFAAYCEQVGLAAALGWVVRLAPHCGVEVRLTRPDFSTRTCSRCDHVNGRPAPGEPFRCVACQHMEAADVNAARVHRKRALAGNFIPPDHRAG